ncbi:MAG: PAS domain S-box protein [Desulfobacula sp.]|uniref:PAS domain S-box protein n=1 Tax=Desulfobacula sp. TaxID=2593537 RepID=UPI001ED21EEE|nr:PAS domain S-box protein [Desulfobacula sp.]
MVDKPSYEELEQRVQGLQKITNELRQAEKALLENEKKFRFLTENIADIVWTLDRNFKTTYVSPSIENMLGFTPKERKQQSLEEMITPDSLQKIQMKFLEELEHDEKNLSDPERFITMEVQYYRKDNSIVWMENSIKAIRDPAGKIVGMHGVSRDINKRKKAEEKLRDSETRFRILTEQSPNMVFINANGKIVYVNDRCFEMMGYSKDEFYSHDFNFLSLMEPESQKQAKSFFKKHMENIEVPPLEYKVIKKDGSMIETIINTKLIDYQGESAILGVVTDITEQKRIENELRIRDEKLSHLSNQTEQLSLATASMISIKEEQEFFDKISKAIVDFSDFKRVIISLFKDQSPFRDIIAFGGVESDLIDKLRKVEMPKAWYDKVFIEENIVGHFSYYIPHTKKNILNQEATIYGSGFVPEFENRWHPEDNLFVRMNDQKGNSIGVISVDESKSGLKPSPERVRPLEIFSNLISQIVILKKEQVEKRDIEAQLQQAQKMESIGTLAGGIAHDFNNILGIIVGNTELALDDVPKWNSAYHSLEEIKKASLRAKNIVKQLLSFSRKTDQKLQPIQIALVIKDALKFLRSTIPTTINIHQRIQTTEEMILADPTQINQIIMNLCINASHAMEQTGGDLSVTLKKVILDNNSAKNNSGLKSGAHVKIMISDTGPGIDPEIIDQIFDPYFTTKEVGKGSGMGLAVVHGIVKNHSGTIVVENGLGKGTTFIIFFPLASKKAMVESKISQDIPRGNETILFVDDEISIVKMVKRMFERLGYKVETATTPQDALERFSSNPDHFDLVITDMTMPQMTGVKLSEKLMAIREDIPIIICTGHSALVDEERAKDLGLAAYVMKPIDMLETAQTIRKVLEK